MASKRQFKKKILLNNFRVYDDGLNNETKRMRIQISLNKERTSAYSQINNLDHFKVSRNDAYPEIFDLI